MGGPPTDQHPPAPLAKLHMTARWGDEVRLPPQGWSASGVEGAADGPRLGRERPPSAFHLAPGLHLSPPWPVAGVWRAWTSISWSHDTSNKICLGSGGLYLAVRVLCLQHTFLSCDSRQKGQMQKKNGGKTVDERQLFHGTSAGFVDAICQQNFDWRVCGLHGTSFGKGKSGGGHLWQNPALLCCPGPRKPF